MDLQNASGDLHIERGGERIEVTLYRVRDAACVISLGDEAERATVRIRSRNRRGTDCQINVAVRLPVGASAALTLGSGDLHAVDVESRVRASVGAGDVLLEGASGWQLELGAGNVSGTLTGASAIQVGAGNVQLNELSSPVTAEVGAGRIHLGYTTAPVGRIDAITGVGDVEIDLPDGTPVTLVNARDPDERARALGTTLVRAQSGLGHVRVH
ncbi:MAG: hypothetical protein KTR31_39915 [Myxococcales bacterium]|nr:hypothetical protein [Myxococcales bacterium]